MNATLIGFNITYPGLTDKVFLEDELGYKRNLYSIKYEQALKGVVIKTLYPPTKKGTSIHFVMCNSQKEFDEYCENLKVEHDSLA